MILELSTDSEKKTESKSIRLKRRKRKEEKDIRRTMLQRSTNKIKETATITEKNPNIVK